MIHLLCHRDFMNEVQVATQVFFPGETFAFVETVAESGYTVEFSTDTAVVYNNGTEIARYFFCGEDGEKFLTAKRKAILTVYHALQKAVGAYTPWGALTGIRPSKLVREWLDCGCDNEEIITALVDVFCCNEKKARLALSVAHAENKLTSVIAALNQVKHRNPPEMPIGIYISIPFCPTRCVYCSFNSSQKPPGEFFLEKYISALIDEIKKKSSHAKISSIYIGGGTPTFLSEYLLEKLLCAVGSEFDVSNTTEYTVEAGRPDTLTPAKLKILRNHNVNRIAVNPQTLNDTTLKSIGRNHTAADFLKAFSLAREAGFTCINTDLIAGLSNETPDDMRRNMEVLKKLLPENITIHTLAVKRASVLNERRHEKNLPKQQGANESSAVESMLSIAAEECAAMGLSPYYL
ncbi:MAG: coproporphyrinogen dehydrogenase HemZ, partial [Clostridiales bacterium]|nr:coproporphyrinogen dehydrogenase HemZ [Clostridiales bacterium]